MTGFSFDLRTQVLFGENRFAELGALARALGFSRTLLVSDPGLQSQFTRSTISRPTRIPKWWKRVAFSP
jgi:alcohol dehydrogenase class IV